MTAILSISESVILSDIMDKLLVYQVLPRFWGNGRFSSWKSEEFNYLKSLGVNGIWYTGIVRHASGEDFVKGDPGCPYSICDYYDVNPYLADVEDNRMLEFEKLLKRTHRAGLRAFIDFVPNHIAKNYRDSRGGIPHFDYCDYDWTDTLKIDYSRPETWEAMTSILRYWASLGVDGFRCDMVELVPVEFFHKAIAEIKKEFPAVIFIAEVYDRNNYARFLDYGGFDLLYDKSGIYDSLRAIMCSGDTAERISWNWQSLSDLQSGMLNFLENHDEQRIASTAFLGAPNKAYAGLAAAALFNDASFMLYSGQEVGESAPDSDNGRTSIFNWTTVDVMGRRRGNPVLKRYREILSHLSNPAFRNGGNWDLGYCNDISTGFDRCRHFAFLRYSDAECWLVVCNFSDTAANMTIRIPEDEKKQCRPEKDSIEVNVGAFDAAIVRI